MKRPYKKLISVLLTAAMLHLCWLTSYGWAEMVRTQETPHKITREMLIDVLHREDVRKQLQHYGISQVEAVARINSLTDEEISAGWAAMRKTKEALKIETPPQITRGMLIDALNREEVQKQLEQYGISKVEAVARINSLTDAEVAAIATEVGQLPSGGLAAIGAVVAVGGGEILIYMAIAAVYLAIAAAIAAATVTAYLLGLFFKGTECIFSDCEAKGGWDYIFRPWWKNTGNSSIKTDDGDYQEDGHPGNTFPTDDLKNEDCDPGWESCT